MIIASRGILKIKGEICVSNYMEIFRDNLRKYIDGKGIDQKDLAVDTGITPASISRWMTGKAEPDVANVLKIVATLGVSIDYLFGLTDIKTPGAKLSPEQTLLIRYYNRMSSRDKKIVWTMLEGYMNDDEKNNPISGII